MQRTYAVRTLLDAKVPMRDGVRLSADLYLPDGIGPFPTVLIRTPYNNAQDELIRKARALANLGYACVLQDCRGRFDSEGDFYPFVNEAQDGYDTQEWIGQQPWCNGKIGTMGASYVGWVQIASAPLRSRYLTCIAPDVITAAPFAGMTYPGGAPQLSVLMMWSTATAGRTAQSIDYTHWREVFRTLPLLEVDTAAGCDLPYVRDWLQHPTYDEYWSRINVQDRLGEVEVPSVHVGGWFDLFSASTFASFNALRQHGRTPAARQPKLIVGPWPHAISASTKTGDVDFGAASMLDLNVEGLRWLDYWLKGIDTGIAAQAPLRLFIMGLNAWRDEQKWPLARTDWQRWYFHSRGHANTLLGDGVLSPTAPAEELADSFVYHPLYPVPTTAGGTCCWPHVVPWGPYDQRDVEMRTDVLCYTSAPLEQDLEVTGPIKVVLYAASDCRDTDWTAKLIDVWPSGYAMSLCDGIQRASYRESLSEPSPIQPGEVYRYEIDLAVTGNVFLKGHQIRVEISSSNFPHYARNLNTGEPVATGREIRVAHQTVLHTRAYPSHIVLPVIPASE